MKTTRFLLVTAFSGLAALNFASADDTIVHFDGKDGPGHGKKIVLLTGDEEYRSEEGLPMLAQILSEKHGFDTTVLFSLDKDGKVDPTVTTSLSGSAALDSADAIIMLLRFRNWPEQDMARFDKAFKKGLPIVALRTSTHAFNIPGEAKSAFAKYTWGGGGDWKGGFGKHVLGDTWISHWGNHKKEATKGLIEAANAQDPVLKGVANVFGTTDVYEAYPPADATILLRGEVLKGMDPGDPPAVYNKKRASDNEEQDVNGPPMPVAWTRTFTNEAGTTNRILTTTMGAATDLTNEGLRRLIVNGVYWGLKMDVPATAEVPLPEGWSPSAYGFGGQKKGLKPADFVPPAGKK